MFYIVCYRVFLFEEGNMINSKEGFVDEVI